MSSPLNNPPRHMITLASWFEHMTFKYLQYNRDIPEFTAVRQAVTQGLKSLTGFTEVEFQSNFDAHELDVMYENAGTSVWVHSSQLSDGYRVALNLFADIAYRAATLNPQLGDNVLRETEGIVLIDEVDLHLHPQWQQLVLSDLAQTFPRMQFVVTTHAPSVISSAKDSQLIIVDGSDICPISSGFYGKDANSVLREVMGVSERPKAVKNMFDMFYGLIDGEEFDRAEEVLDALGSLLGESDSELTSCRVQLDLERMDLS